MPIATCILAIARWTRYRLKSTAREVTSRCIAIADEYFDVNQDSRANREATEDLLGGKEAAPQTIRSSARNANVHEHPLLRLPGPGCHALTSLPREPLETVVPHRPPQRQWETPNPIALLHMTTRARARHRNDAARQCAAECGVDRLLDEDRVCSAKKSGKRGRCCKRKYRCAPRFFSQKFRAYKSPTTPTKPRDE